MNLSDLKDLLDERATDNPPAVSHDARLAGVKARVRAGRQRTLAFTALGVLALASIGATAAMLPTPTAEPQQATSPPGEFPPYLLGTHVVQEVILDLPERSVAVRFEAKGDAVAVLLRCPGMRETTLRTQVTAFGHTEEVLCSGGTALQTFEGHGVTQIGLTITGAQRSTDGSTVDMPASGSAVMAVADPVPWEDYPFPERPENLQPIITGAPCHAPECVYALESDPDDPTTAVAATVTWQTVSMVSTVVNTPGILHVQINGVEVGSTASWDYIPMAGSISDVGAKTGELRPGDEVTIAVTPEHLSGPWRVEFLNP